MNNLITYRTNCNPADAFCRGAFVRPSFQGLPLPSEARLPVRAEENRHFTEAQRREETVPTRHSAKHVTAMRSIDPARSQQRKPVLRPGLRFAKVYACVSNLAQNETQARLSAIYEPQGAFVDAPLMDRQRLPVPAIKTGLVTGCLLATPQQRGVAQPLEETRSLT